MSWAWIGRQWKVTSSGVDTLDNRYFIAKHRVWENEGTDHDWASHMEDKYWVDIGDFRRAMAEARKRWPKGSVDEDSKVVVPKGATCDIYPLEVDALGERSGGTQWASVWCHTHQTWESHWVPSEDVNALRRLRESMRELEEVRRAKLKEDSGEDEEIGMRMTADDLKNLPTRAESRDRRRKLFGDA